MKCLIDGCNVEKPDLTQHIIKEHGMSTKEYKRIYNVTNLIDEEVRIKRGLSRRTNEIKRPFVCPICSELRFRTEKLMHRHCFEKRDADHSKIIYKDDNPDGWVECAICNFRSNRIDFHLKNVHQINSDEYKNKYNKEIMSKDYHTTLKKSASSKHESEKFIGNKNPFFEKHHQEQTKNQISETLKENNSKLIIHFNKGKTHTEETCKKMSESRAGEKNPMFGKPPAEGTSFGIQGYRKDIGHSVRSTLEANYARHLKHNNIKYEYEPKSFLIINNNKKENCWIDFHLIETDEWIELKNYKGRDTTKIELVKQQYPMMNIKILYQDSDEWKEIENKYKPLIELWEINGRNLKTNPELYVDIIKLDSINFNENLLPIEKSIIQALSIPDREILADKIFQHFKEKGFPKLQYGEKELFDDFFRVKKSTIHIENNNIQCLNSFGYKIRDHFISQQYSCFEKLFQDDKILTKVVRNRIGLDWKVPSFFTFNDKLLIRGFEMLYPQNRFSKYNCILAKWIVDNFCDGNNVYDYAAGWGSRLIATVASGKNYIAVDNNESLVKELNNLSNWIKQINDCEITIEHGDASSFKPTKQIDLAYSCPPYGIQEKYDGITFKNDNDWYEYYLKPVIKNCYEVLRSKGKFVCHISTKLSEITKYELNKYFKFIDCYNVINRHSPFQKTRNRINEVILIYEKS